jgi:hypothetical protein
MKKLRFDPLNWLFPVGKDERILDVEERRLQRSALEAQEDLTGSEVAEFVLSAVMFTIGAKQDMIRTLEAKAASQVGFAGAILAIMVTLGRSDSTKLLFLIAMGALTLCILSNLYAMFVSEYDAPSPLLYNLPSVLNDARNKGKIATSLAEAYGRYGLDLGVEAGKKSRYVRAGTILLATGIAFVLLSAFFPNSMREINIECPNGGCAVTVTQGVQNAGRQAERHDTSPHPSLRKGDGRSRRYP